MTTEPHDHKEQGYEGTGLGPADHDADHQDADPDTHEEGVNSDGHDSGSGHREDRSSSVPQENLGDS